MLPCENRFNRLEELKEDMELCWDEVDLIHSSITLGGSNVAASCTSAAATGNPVAVKTCAIGLAALSGGYSFFWNKMKQCNKRDLKAYAAAKDFEKCAAEHKEFLNSLLQSKN